MSTSATVKIGKWSSSSATEGVPNNTFMRGVSVANPADNQELLRTKLFFEMNVVTYINDHDLTSLSTGFWDQAFPCVGVLWTEDGSGAGTQPVPLSNSANNNWIINEALQSQVVYRGTDANANEYLWVRFATDPTSLVSKVRRKPSASLNALQLWLCWEWYDPTNLINHTSSFPQFYDLSAKWYCRSWWQALP